MVSGTKNVKKPKIFNDFYELGTVPIFKGKKRKNVSELMAVLAIQGPSTTYDLARFVLRWGLTAGQASAISPRDVEKLSLEYKRLLTGRQAYKSGRKKLGKFYPGIIKNGYAKQVGTKLGEKKHVDMYFLTLRGSFLVLGYELADSELKSVIKNASRNSLYFAYVNSVLVKTSIKFVKEVFIEPIKEVIKKGRIFLNEDISFYFSVIAETTSNALGHKMEDIFKKYFSQESDNLQPFLLQSGVEDLLDETRYVEKPKEDWADVLIENYYPDSHAEEFYRFNSDELSGARLVYQVMRAIHFTYYNVLVSRVPPKPRKKLLRSKRWKEHKKIRKYRAWNKP